MQLEAEVRDVGLERTADSDREVSLRLLAIHRRIVAVAKHKFGRMGYDGVSLGDIQRAADLSSEDFRIHFEDKRILLDEVMREGWKSLASKLADIAFASPNARLGMLALLALMINVLEEDEDWVRLVLFEGRHPDPESGEMMISGGYRKFQHLCTELVVRGQQEGTFRREYHPEVVGSMLIGAIEGIMRDRLLAEQQHQITPYSGRYMMSAFDGLVSYLNPNHDR